MGRGAWARGQRLTGRSLPPRSLNVKPLLQRFPHLTQPQARPPVPHGQGPVPGFRPEPYLPCLMPWGAQFPFQGADTNHGAVHLDAPAAGFNDGENQLHAVLAAARDPRYCGRAISSAIRAQAPSITASWSPLSPGAASQMDLRSARRDAEMASGLPGATGGAGAAKSTGWLTITQLPLVVPSPQRGGIRSHPR